MPEIVYTGGVKCIRGTINNMIYKLGPNGQTIIQNKSTSVRNPNSAEQASYRSAMKEFGQRWRINLTAAQQADWESFAQNALPFNPTTASGVRVFYKRPKGSKQGLHRYCKCNIQAKTVGRTTPIDDAPPFRGSVPNFTADLSAVWDDVEKKIVVTFTDPNPGNAHAFIRVFIRPSGRRSATHKHRAARAPSSAGRVEIRTVKGANGDELPASYVRGEFLYIVADFVNDNTGMDSAQTNTVKIKCMP